MKKTKRLSVLLASLAIALMAIAGLTVTTAAQAAVDVPLLVFQGAWVKNCAYHPGAIVTYSGASYVSLALNTIVTPGSNANDWALLDAQGATGPQGPQGPAGPVGPRKLDVASFFPSILKARLYAIIARHIADPTRQPHSQFWANVYLNELDQYVKRELGCRHYVRYVDDLVLLAPHSNLLLEWCAAIEAFLGERLGLTLPPTSSCRCRGECE